MDKIEDRVERRDIPLNSKNSKITAIMLIPIALAISIIALYMAQETNINFEDENLELAVREELNIKEGPIRKEDVEQVDKLDLSYSGIESLHGIEAMITVRHLNLEGNRIKDISPLEELTYLEELNLRENRINDFSVLSNLKRITSLDLRDTGMDTLDPVGEIIQLTDLNVRGNNIKSLQPLENLEQLSVLNVRNNQIEDISVLTNLEMLEDINLRNNRIQDFSSVFHLPNLTTRLYVMGNPGVDIKKFVPLYEKIENMDIDEPELALTFNMEGGVYPNPQTIELSQVIGAEGTIRYTLDGSEPSEQSKAYKNPIHLEETTVVKARFYDQYGNAGERVSNTYVIGENSTLPVVSLSGNPEDFFSETFGIYTEGAHTEGGEEYNEEANYAQSGDLWEREATVEMYKPDGTEMIHQQAGVRLHGNKSRNYPKKSFRLYARSDYDTENTFNYPLFPKEEESEFNRLILRNSGNDWDETLFRDAFLQELIGGFDVETQALQPVNLYLNGEYWGVYNLRERIDNHHFEFKYGITEDRLEYLEHDSKVRVGDNRHYVNMLTYIKENDIKDPKVYKWVSEQMDMNSFIDYNIAEIYVSNLDWPANNIRYWREKPNGKWQWTVYDLDFGFGKDGVEETVAHHTLNFATEEGNTGWPNPDWSTFLLRSLLENEEFRARFAGTFSHYLNTHFNEDRVTNKLDKFASIYQPEIERNIKRWNAPESMEKWQENVNVMREFGLVRDDYMYAHLVDFFDLSGYANMTVTVESDQQVEVYGKDIPMDSNKEWTGMYTADTPLEIQVEGKKAVLTAKENEGNLIDEKGRLVLPSKGNGELVISDHEGNRVGTISVEGIPVEKDTISLDVGEEFNWSEVASSKGTYATIDNPDLGDVNDRTFTAESAGEGLLTVHNEKDQVVSMMRVKIVQPAKEPSVYNEGHPSATYQGTWHDTQNENHHRGTASYSEERGGEITITFEGTGIRWYGYKGPSQGIATIQVDGGETDSVDTYNQKGMLNTEIYSVTGLEKGRHTMTITVTGKKNEQAKNHRIHIDSFEVIG
ncbi:CotH kinase family protein [Alteribacillus iranensis]|uniref:CotH kinase family protein n=1 Tax=Alteribacillus iranensis TaxID=930128 RepID=UPI000B198FA0|nr:CotH kinase family protein [Alteribacillus iranensis]